MKFFLFVFFLFFVGCGYKPSSVYQDKIIGNKINAKVEIDVKNPQESIILKDALNDVLYSNNKYITSKNYDSFLKIDTKFSNLEVLDYDKNGFPSIYRSNVILKITLINKYHHKKEYIIKSFYDFSISSDSIITEEYKLEAFKRASINALNKFFAKLSKEGN